MIVNYSRASTGMEADNYALLHWLALQSCTLRCLPAALLSERCWQAATFTRWTAELPAPQSFPPPAAAAVPGKRGMAPLAPAARSRPAAPPAGRIRECARDKEVISRPVAPPATTSSWDAQWSTQVRSGSNTWQHEGVSS